MNNTDDFLKKSKFDSLRVMSSNCHNWDSELLKSSVIHPSGQNSTVGSPIVMVGANKQYTEVSEIQKHFLKKVKQSKKTKKPARRAKKPVRVADDDEEMPSESSEDSEDNGLVMNNTGAVEDELVSFNPKNDPVLFADQVTAGLRSIYNYGGYGVTNFSSYRNEYIIPDRAQVRVRYIVQLKTSE